MKQCENTQEETGTVVTVYFCLLEQGHVTPCKFSGIPDSDRVIAKLREDLRQASFQVSEAREILTVLLDAGVLENYGKLGDSWAARIRAFIQKRKCECGGDELPFGHSGTCAATFTGHGP